MFVQYDGLRKSAAGMGVQVGGMRRGVIFIATDENGGIITVDEEVSWKGYFHREELRIRENDGESNARHDSPTKIFQNSLCLVHTIGAAIGYERLRLVG